jgi:hypothetical protein
MRLAAQAETADQALVARFVNTFEVVEQSAALGNHFQKTTTGMVVILVAFKVIGQVGNAFRKNGYLYFRRTGITFFGCILFDKSLFAFSSNRHRNVLFVEEEKSRPRPRCRPAGAVYFSSA